MPQASGARWLDPTNNPEDNRLSQILAAADYLGNGAIEINKYESEIFDIIRRTSVITAAAGPQAGDGPSPPVLRAARHRGRRVHGPAQHHAGAHRAAARGALGLHQGDHQPDQPVPLQES